MEKKNMCLTDPILTFLLLFLCSAAATAQIRIVDEQDGKPIAGAYIFSSDNHLLCISDANGNTKPLTGTVTISTLSHEAKTIHQARYG